MRPAAVLLLAFALGIGGCASSVDRQRATTCRRAVPALAPPDSPVTVLRVAAGPSADSVRVDYETGRRDGRQRWLVCRFGTGAVLAGIVTERGPVGEAALYLLRHYYLDTPEGVAADPAARVP